MVAQEWSGNDLRNSVYFEPDEQGFDLFKTYLKSINNEPIRLLVDLIEEEFRQASLPFVRGTDRRALIQRNLEKFFRNTRFRRAISQKVEKFKNRKEESFLFTGLTNPDLLEPWLKAIDDTKTPLSGVVSLPLISERFVAKLPSDNKCVILVSQQVPSNLRQSVFVDGKLMLSRLVPIASFYQGNYAADVVRDIDSTQRYLVSQRLIECFETVTVHILSNGRHYDKLTVACVESSYFDFEIHNINDLLKKEKIDLYDEQDFSSTLFCHEATTTKFENHYASKDEKRYFTHYLVGLGLKIVGIAIFSVGLALGVSSATQGYLYKDNIEDINNLQKQYDTQFERLASKTKALPASTTDMKLAVKTASIIQNNYKTSPKEFLVNVSQDLVLFADLRAIGVNWFISDDNENNLAKDVIWDQKVKRKKRKSKSRKAAKKEAINGYYEIVVLEGEFIEFGGNYRYALSVLSDLEDFMKESGKYDEVVILKRPLSIDGDSVLTGAADIKAQSQVKDATFKVKIVKKVELNVK